MERCVTGSSLMASACFGEWNTNRLLWDGNCCRAGNMGSGGRRHRPKWDSDRCVCAGRWFDVGLVQMLFVKTSDLLVDDRSARPRQRTAVSGFADCSAVDGRVALPGGAAVRDGQILLPRVRLPENAPGTVGGGGCFHRHGMIRVRDAIAERRDLITWGGRYTDCRHGVLPVVARDGVGDAGYLIVGEFRPQWKPDQGGRELGAVPA